MKFDNHDRRIRYFHLELMRDDLENLPQYPLPEGYRFVFFQPGDQEAWIEIERTAGEFDTVEKGWDAWNKYFAPHEDELPLRMVFIEDAEGRKIATASAYFDIRGVHGRDVGYLHWVAVHKSAQGKGLARPLIAYVLSLLRAMGHTKTMIMTQTYSWVACNLYLQFGFLPEAVNAREAEFGWRIIRTLTGAPQLAAFVPVTEAEILNQE